MSNDLALNFVDAMPERPKSGGGPGRKSPYADLLAQLRGDSRPVVLNAEAFDQRKASQIASRIHNGKVQGVTGGEFNTEAVDGKVYVQFAGPDGVTAWNAKNAEREQRKADKAAKASAAAGQSTPGVTESVPAEPAAADVTVTSEDAAPEATPAAAPAFSGGSW